MSTKVSIEYGEGFHFYRDVNDDLAVYLSIERDDRPRVTVSTTVRIALDVWERMRTHTREELEAIG